MNHHDPSGHLTSDPRPRLLQSSRPPAIARVHLRKQAALALLGLSAAPVQGFDFLGSPSSEETATFDRFWQGFTLYRNPDHPILQEFKLRGRFHGQYHDVDASQGDASHWEDRRTRLGFDAKLFRSRFELRLDAGSNDGFRDSYDGLVDAYLKWHVTDTVDLTLGRTKPFIGYFDWLPSTNYQPTFERSQIFNQLHVDRATGITLEASTGDFRWQAGLFSNSVDPDRNDLDQAFGSFNASWSLSLGAGTDLSAHTGWKRSDLQVNWLHSDRDDDSNLLARYEDILSATFWAQDGRWSSVAEGYLATGGLGNDGDVFGAFLLGTFDLIPGRLQLVGRYSFARGDGPASVRGQGRYEGEVSAARGDAYQSLYLGAQYFIHGDRLKLMAGGEYARLTGGDADRNYDGFTWLSGIRFSF